jgi:hypothetical protein
MSIMRIRLACHVLGKSTPFLQNFLLISERMLIIKDGEIGFIMRLAYMTPDETFSLLLHHFITHTWRRRYRYKCVRIN